MPNADYVRHQAQEVPLPLDLMPDDDGLPPPPPLGSVPQIELVIRSDPAAHSRVEVPSGFSSGGFTSDALPGDGGPVMVGVQYRLLPYFAMAPVSSPSTQVSMPPVTWHWQPKITVRIHGSSASDQPRSATLTLFPLVIAS
jgi:hypothetical protein